MRIRLRLGLLMMGLLLWAAPVQATVDISDGFEYADNTAMLNVWSSSCLPSVTGVIDVSSTRAHSGSKSLKVTYPPPDSEGGCFMDRNLSAPTDNFYMRGWIFLDGFSNNTGVLTKMWFAGQGNSYPNFWSGSFSGAPNWGNVISGDPANGTNLFGGSIPSGQWVCVEERISMNTPGVANGVIQHWVNGVLVLDRQNLLLRNAVLSNFNGPNSQIAFIRTYRQHGVGTIYYDDYAASRDARIGCSGSIPTADTTPPTIPIGLQVR